MRPAIRCLVFTLCVSLPGTALAQGPLFGVTLDSGTVARVTWRNDGVQRVRLLEDLTPTSEALHYCHYPSSGCGPGSVNPARVRPIGSVERLELRGRNHAARGALWGAGVGVVLAALTLSLRGLADAPAPGLATTALAAGLVFGSSVGIGALIGTGSYEWEPLP